MADYLLRAPEEDMARWKADAARRNVPFSRHVREMLDRHEPRAADLLRESMNSAPVEAVSSTGVGTPLSEAASTGDRSSPEPGPVSDPAGSAPVDLQARAVELAAKLGKRVEADPK